MTADDLSTPLGQDTEKRRHLPLPLTIPEMIAGALALCVAVFVGWALVVRDPLGGEPIAVALIKAPLDVAAKSEGAPAREGPSRYDGPAAEPASQPGPAPATQTVTIIDGTSGRRQEVAIPTPQETPRGPSGDQRLLDTSRHGPIPKIAADGTRPAEAYARASIPANQATRPRIAIVLTGLNISAAATTAALDKLPGAVTFAFLPYGADVARQVARARERGHEVLLHVPMEPFDYPDNDPGPQTLLTSLSAEQNLDRLHWAMSRFQGYVGVTNFMGARFTATERALAPILQEITRRGLIYFDDGSSPRSLAGQIAGANNLPFARAKVVLDAVATPVHIERALTQLEALAREQGIAVGVAAVAPAAIDRIAQWAKGVESRGLTLVPLSAAALKPKTG